MARKSTPNPKSPAKSPAGPVAAYTMYGGPPVRPAVRQWWTSVARRLKDGGMTGVPAKPNFTLGERDQWTHPNLLLAQTCGFPMMKGVTGPVRLICTPVYDVPYADGVNYCSVVVVDADSEATSLSDLRGRRAAISKPTSHSGYNALRALFAPLARGQRMFRDVVSTGSHGASAAAVSIPELLRSSSATATFQSRLSKRFVTRT